MNRETEIETAIRRLRQDMFNHSEDDQEVMGDKIASLKIELELVRGKKPAATGPFSGLTKAELSSSGTCETDWF